jgi:hypothetical protein
MICSKLSGGEWPRRYVKLFLFSYLNAYTLTISFLKIVLVTMSAQLCHAGQRYPPRGSTAGYAASILA